MTSDYPDHWDRQSRLRKSMDTLFPQTHSDQCRVCAEPVVDGRWNYCSERCRDVANAVQRMFIWDEVREQILERDDYTCQGCGLSREMQWRAYHQTQERIDERAPHPEGFDTEAEYDQWKARRDELQERYDVGSPTGDFHVDHITPISEGGHPFDESNLQTLCASCHEQKTAAENASADPQPDVTLADYLES